MCEIFIKCLGFPEITVNDKPADFKRSKSIALIVYLYLGRRRMTREEIIDIFWPSHDPARAKANLRTVLSECRNLLGRDIFSTEDGTVSISGRIMNITGSDYENFIRLSESSEIPELNEAVELYSDGFMKNINVGDSPVFEDWQFEMSQRVLVAYTACLENLLSAAEKDNKTELRISCCKKLTLIDPLREDYHSNLIKLYIANNDPNSALHQYEILKRNLHLDDGSSPNAETQKLIGEINLIKKNIPVKAETKKGKKYGKMLIIICCALAAVIAVLSIGVYRFRITPANTTVPIAVLPFNFLCEDPGAGRFAESLTIDMITELAKEDLFSVTPHASVRHLKETSLNIMEIAEELEVSFIVDGAAMRYNDAVRFSVQLIDIRKNECIWAGTYVCEVDENIESQEKIVQYIKKCVTDELSHDD